MVLKLQIMAKQGELKLAQDAQKMNQSQQNHEQAMKQTAEAHTQSLEQASDSEGGDVD